MPRSVRVAVVLYAVYAALLTLEAVWAGIGPKWFDAARDWAAMHPPPALARLILGSITGFAVAGALAQGYRLAWFVAIVWAGVLSTLGVALFVAGAIVPPLRAFLMSHQVELVGGIVSIACLMGSVANLRTKEARNHFFRRGEHEKGNAT